MPGVRLESHGRLVIQVLPVNQENCLFNGRNVHQQIPRRFVGSHGFAGTCGMPDKTGLPAFGRGADRFNGVNLIRTQQN